MEIPQLTFSRFVAAFLILVFHFGRNLWPFQTVALQSLLGPYNFAVTYFYVLSGFILWVVYAPRPMRLRQFWVARFARIYPLYLVAWLCVGLPPLLRGQTPLDFVLGSFLLQAWVPGHALALNGPAWSLSVEAFFYLAFPFLLIFFRERRLATTVAIASGFWLLSQILFARLAWEPKYYFPPLHLSSFVWGLCWGAVFMSKPARFRSSAYLWGSLIAWAALNRVEFVRANGHNGLLAPLIGLFITALAANHGIMARLFSARGLIFLGEISFGAYILQVPVRHTWFPLITKHTALSGGYIDFFGFVGVLLAICSLAYVVIEKPARNRLRRLLTGKPITADRKPAGS